MEKEAMGFLKNKVNANSGTKLNQLPYSLYEAVSIIMIEFSASQNSELVERVKKLQSTCLAAAEEIQSKWDAHCDSEGYGPANLMRRLENGVGDWYDGYNSGQFTKLENKNSELKKENEGLRQLAEVWKEYSEFLDKESQSFIQFAHIHGMKVSDDAIKKGKELREKIKQLTK